MSHFILIHGFNDRSAGQDNIDRVTPLLQAAGHTVDMDGTDYGYFGLLMVRLRKHGAVVRILEAIRNALHHDQDVVVVGYSNGCNYGLKAARLIFIGQFRLVLVHPALPTRANFPDSVRQAWVCYTESDIVGRLASWVRWLIPGWGRMGAVGYKGKDPRILNINYSDVAKGHGGLWRDPALQVIAEDLDRLARSKT